MLWDRIGMHLSGVSVCMRGRIYLSKKFDSQKNKIRTLKRQRKICLVGISEGGCVCGWNLVMVNHTVDITIVRCD